MANMIKKYLEKIMGVAPVAAAVVLCFLYIGALLFLTLLVKHWWIWAFLVWALVMIIAGIVAGVIIFGEHFLAIFIVPFLPFEMLLTAIQYRRLKNYLKTFKQNKPAETVLILGHPKWSKLEAWMKPNFYKGEVRPIVEYLEAKKQDFSFYPSASFDDVEKIMANKNVKEVYFLGHGNSHIFKLNDECDLYYCDFNDPKYGKEFVHQVHCGTKYGKSLYEYVVPKENWSGCFLIRKLITGWRIKKEFKKRKSDLQKTH